MLSINVKRLPAMWFAALVLLFSSCSSMCAQKPALKNTTWKCVYEMFICDAGTETTTVTIKFLSDKNFQKESHCVLPPYPAMYMNQDGSIDTMPGHDSSYTEKGTYKYRRGILVLTSEDGSSEKFYYKGGKFVGEKWGMEMVFTRER